MNRAARALDVWMNGEPVGVWRTSRQGTPELLYHREWLESPHARPLSLSLPLLPGNEPHRGDHVAAWFDNLLPESAAIRDRIRLRFGTHSTNAFHLLSAIGRDCVGAVQIVPEGSDPGDVRRIAAEPIPGHDLAHVVRQATAPPGMGADAEDDAFRISIAGAQEKTALLRLGDSWYRPREATPTTHILKLPLGLIGNMRADMRDSVENEWLCMTILGQLGLPVPSTEMATFRDDVGEEKVLVVERFDRQLAGGDGAEWILRLPQEDLCQATGTPAFRKYETDGGPGIADCLSLLQAGDRPAEDAVTFAKAQLAFWLLAAPDGHAKNFSIFLRRDGYVMTPLYDVISAWPVIGHGPNLWAEQKVTLAMALRGRSPHRHLRQIAIRHWKALAARTGVPDAFERMEELVESAEQALESVEGMLPEDFPLHVWRSISDGVIRQRKAFLSVAD